MMPQQRHPGWLLTPAALLVVMASGLLARPARADSVVCEVRSIHGSNRPGELDQRLAFVRRQLSKPPFSVFKSFSLLERKELTVKQRQTVQTGLPTKKVLRLTFKERLFGPKKKVRLRMHLSITPPRAIGFLPGTLFNIEDRGTFFVAGDPYDGGTLIVGITCRSR